MTKTQFFQFISFLRQKNWRIFGPMKGGEGVLIKKLEKPEDFYFGRELPQSSFKEFFLLPKEVLLEFNGSKILTPPKKEIKTALFGVGILDLKTILLYDAVFKDDPYYRRRRENILVIGWGIRPNPGQNIYNLKFAGNLLPHLKFDIFLAPAAGKFRVYVGSESGKKILSDFGWKKWIPVRFRGQLSEESLINKFRSKLKKGSDLEIWRKLGEICIECGKCSEICPTCFCFRINDNFCHQSNGEKSLPAGFKKNKSFRQRSWDSCFFEEFSQVAGGHKFLDTTQKRIHFWYEHKFARIPDEYNMLGCVGCRRCSKVCPVDIDIERVLRSLTKSRK